MVAASLGIVPGARRTRKRGWPGRLEHILDFLRRKRVVVRDLRRFWRSQPLLSDRADIEIQIETEDERHSQQVLEELAQEAEANQFELLLRNIRSGETGALIRSADGNPCGRLCTPASSAPAGCRIFLHFLGRSDRLCHVSSPGGDLWGRQTRRWYKVLCDLLT